MAEHSIAAPSSSGRWVHCEGSIMLEARVPDTSKKDAANEGLCSHELAADLIYHWANDRTLDPENLRIKYVGKYSFHGVKVTDAIFDGALLYVRDVIIVSTGCEHGKNFAIEDKLQIPKVHDVCFGTCDCWYFNEVTGILHIWDLKYGFLAVEAYANWQLLCYASGIVSNGIKPKFIDIRIVQPRSYRPGWPVHTWQFKAGDLQSFEARLNASANRALGNTPTVMTGPHCRFCRARYGCGAANNAAMSAFEYVEVPQLCDLSPEQLGRELQYLTRAKEAIEYRHAGVSQQIESLLKQGKNVPQWEMRSKGSKREWATGVEELKAIGALYDVKVTKEKPITVKQAIDAGIPQDMVEALTTVKSGKRYLLPHDMEAIGRKFKNA